MPKTRKTTSTRPQETGSTSTSGTSNPSFTTNPKDLLDQVQEQEQTPTLKAFDESGYNQGRKLGNGAFGNVYQLDPTKKSKKKGRGKLALKTAKSKEGEEDLKNEASVLEKVGEHENIVGYEGVGKREGDTTTLALEYLGGGDLQKMQDQLESAYKARKISHEQYWGTMQYLMRGITSGIGHMNEQGLVHGDLKMGNVGLNSETLTPKVLDFGTTREIGDTYHQAMTPSINLTPERYGDNAKVSKTNDLYAIGQMTHYAGKGKFFNEGNGGPFGAQMARYQEHEDAKKGNSVNPFTKPTAFDEFLGGTLAPNPEDRMTANEALQTDFLSDSMMNDEGAKDVLRQMLTDRSNNVEYGDEKSELDLVKESQEGRAQRLANARVQNKQDKMSGKKALKQAKKGKSKKDVKQKSAMLKELEKKTKGTRKALDKDAEKRRKRK